MPEEGATSMALDQRGEGLAPLATPDLAGANVEQPGDEHLLFLCGGVACAAPLRALREVLLSCPRPVFLPFSPPWLLGVCPLRLELVGLVDPVPMLLGDRGDGTPFWPVEGATSGAFYVRTAGTDSGPAPALVVSGVECSLCWVVQAVGDIARILPEEIVTAPEQIADARLPFVARYVRGVYAPDNSDQRHVVLNVQRLMSDLVDAMREKDNDRG